MDLVHIFQFRFQTVLKTYWNKMFQSDDCIGRFDFKHAYKQVLLIEYYFNFILFTILNFSL